MMYMMYFFGDKISVLSSLYIKTYKP